MSPLWLWLVGFTLGQGGGSDRDDPGLRVFVRVDRAPSSAEIAVLAEHGVDGFLVDAGDAATLAVLADRPLAVENVVTPGQLRLHREDFDLYYDAYLRDRAHGLTQRPFCFNRLPGREELREEAVAAGRRLRPLRPTFISLTADPSWTLADEPLDWCLCVQCQAAWRTDLLGRFANVARVRDALRLPEGADIRPWTVDEARAHNEGRTLSEVELGPWLDYRSFMDRELARELEELAGACGDASGVPVGFLGGAPSNPFGGHDWWRLAGAVGIVNPPDDPTSREVVRSCAGGARLLVDVQRTGGTEALARRRLIEQYLIGARLAVARQLSDLLAVGADARVVASPLLVGIGEVLATLRGPLGELFRSARPVPPRIGLVYSPRSLKVEWLRQASRDGLYWVTRTHRLGRDLLPCAGTWWAWQLLLDDLGLPYRFLGEDELVRPLQLGSLDALILPRCIALSAAAAERIRAFVAAGGLLLIDGEAGLVDEFGNGRAAGVFDAWFGIRRATRAWDLDVGDDPAGAVGRVLGLRRLESGIVERSAGVARIGRGSAFYLDLRLADYLDLRIQDGDVGRAIAATAAEWFAAAGLTPVLRVQRTGKPGPAGTRLLRYASGAGELVAVVATADVTELSAGRAVDAMEALDLTLVADRDWSVRVVHGAVLAGGGGGEVRVSLPRDGLVLLRMERR